MNDGGERMERIDKLLSATGRWSRKEVKELVRQGRVLADGRTVQKPEEKADSAAVCLTVDGAEVDCAPFVYVMLYKPAGLLSATEDKNQPTVLDLLPPELKKRGLFPVGRLDKDTTGLLLLTDDGALAHELLSPKKHVDKVTGRRWRGAWTAGTWPPWLPVWCWGTGRSAFPPVWSLWRMDQPAWLPCGRASTTR